MQSDVVFDKLVIRSLANDEELVFPLAGVDKIMSMRSFIEETLAPRIQVPSDRVRLYCGARRIKKDATHSKKPVHTFYSM